MARSSILGEEDPVLRPAGHDIDTLGPSDSSDSGSDVQGETVMPTLPDDDGTMGAVIVGGMADSDSGGTGERASANARDPVDGADILPDRIVGGPSDDGEDDLERLSGESDDEGGFDTPADGGASGRDSGPSGLSH